MSAPNDEPNPKETPKSPDSTPPAPDTSAASSDSNDSKDASSSNDDRPTPKPDAPPAKSGLRKKLLIAACSLLGLLVVFYFVATSALFVKSAVLPKVGEILDAKITLGEASISPFSEVSFDNIEVAANGEETLANIGSVKARYSLMDIVGGNIKVDEVTVDSPTINLVIKEDGSTNLDPILKALASDEPPPPAGPTPNLDVKNVSIKNATIKLIQHLGGGASQTVEMKNVNLDLDQLGNGKTGKLNLAAALGLNTPTDKLSASLQGGYDVELGADLMPSLISGKASVNIDGAEGSLKQAKGLSSELAVELTPTELKETSLKFNQSGKQLGQISINGPFDSEKLSADLRLVVDAIDKNVLNLVGALAGLDFETTTLTSESRITVTPNAELLVVQGGVKVGQLALTQITPEGRGPTTPAMDIGLDYDLAVNLTGQTATLSGLALNGSTSKGAFLSGDLAAPVTATFGDAPKITGNAAYKLNVTDFDLAPWKAFTGPSAPAGSIGLALDISADSSGENVYADYSLQFNQAGAQVAESSGKVAVELASMAIDLKAAAKAELSNLQLADAPILPAEKNARVNLTVDTAFDGKTLDLAKLESTFHEGEKQITSLGLAGKVNLGDTITLTDTAVQLAPTARANNKLTINGQVTPGDLLAGNLVIKSDGLDVTPFMDLFMPEEATKEPAAEAPPAEQPPAPPAPKPEQEPDAIELPIEKFNVEVALATFFAREIAVSNYVTKVAIVGSKVNVDPVSLTFNGAPLNAKADLNLGVPGYEYDVALKIDHLPIAPLVDTFSPEFKGKIKAEIITDVAIKGAGVTGVSLKKNLSGHAGATLTNAVMNVLEKGILMKSVATLLQAPEILEPPLDYLNAFARIGQGSVNIENFIVQSAAFQATATGGVTLDDTLTNSALNIPIGVSLSKNLAKIVKLTGVDQNAKYTPLPDFATVGGTVGAHKVQLDRGKLLAVGIQAAPAAALNAIEGAAGAAVNVTEKATQTLNKLTEGTVGGILGALGDSTAKSTPKDGKKSGGLGGLFDALGGGKKQTTNATPQNMTNKTDKATGLKIPFNPFKKQ